MAAIVMTDSAECLESCRRAAADVRRTIAQARSVIVGTRALLSRHAHRGVSPLVL